MSKSKVYKRKKNQPSAKIFVVMAVILVVLIIVVAIITSIDNSKFNGLIESYVENEYGEKQNIKLRKGTDSAGMTVYVSDDYYYYPDDNIIYDIAKNTAALEPFNARAIELGADLGTVEQAVYSTHTDGSDFAKAYDFVQFTATYEGSYASQDEVAKKIWNYIDALNDEYPNIAGMFFGYSTADAFYQVAINVTDKEPVTLEKIQANISTIELEPTEDTEGVELPVEDESLAEGEEAPAEENPDEAAE